jgi:uncharacterized protein
VSQDLELLIALHEIDITLNQHRTQMREFAKERETIEAEYQTFASAFLSAQSSLETARKQCRELEAELADIQERHEKYKQDLQRVRNQKEYEVALREIDVAKKSAAQLETQILEVMEEIKRGETAVASYSPDIERKRSEADGALAACQKNEARRESDVAAVQHRRGEIEAQLSQTWLNHYRRIAKIRSGQVLARVVNGSCSGCRMKLRPQVFSQVRQNIGIHACDNCGRILFYRPEPSSETATATA